MQITLDACVFAVFIACHNIWRTADEVAREINGAEAHQVKLILLTRPELFSVRCSDRGTQFRLRNPMLSSDL